MVYSEWTTIETNFGNVQWRTEISDERNSGSAFNVNGEQYTMNGRMNENLVTRQTLAQLRSQRLSGGVEGIIRVLPVTTSSLPSALDWRYEILTGKLRIMGFPQCVHTIDLSWATHLFNLLNAELSSKRYWREWKFQEVKKRLGKAVAIFCNGYRLYLTLCWQLWDGSCI